NSANISTGASGRFGVSEGTGVINIINNSSLTSRLVDMGRQGDPNNPPVNTINATLNIGSNSTVTSAQLLLPRNTGSATMTVTGGSKWIGQAFDTITGVTFTASLKTDSANVTVSDPGTQWTLPSTFITSGGAATATGDPLGAGTTSFTVQNGALVKA